MKQFTFSLGDFFWSADVAERSFLKVSFLVFACVCRMPEEYLAIQLCQLASEHPAWF